MSKLIPRRELITASAGSGKTFQLTDRYVGLLLGGEDPESIVALTFSRKAAGEFFDAILTKLATAASDEEERASLNRRLATDADAATYRAKLASLLSVMHKLTLGTLDSFFHKILSRFPMEHGLGGDFGILDESSFQLQLGRALEVLFQRGRSSPELGDNLATAFRAACAGSDDRAFAGWLVSLADQYRSLRSLCPEEDRWGDPKVIWAEGAPWLEGDDESFAADLDACREKLSRNDLSDPTFTPAELAAWGKVFDSLEAWRPGEAIGPSPVLRARIFEAFRDWTGGKVEVLKKPSTDEYFVLDERFARPLSRVVRNLLRREFSRRMTRTRGAYGGLSANEWVYDEWVRRRGGLTFADLPLLLGHADPLDRMQVEYRLDGTYRHWMLDEFQDTSPAQWRVLENLVDEAIRDESKARAFFCVGDVKQAIYGWRGGDSRLFDVLRKRYEGHLSEDGLNESWRSGPDVLGAVNEVFGGTGLFGVSSSRWEKEWKEHEPSELTRDLPGQVAWWTTDDAETRNRNLVELLREIDPVRRGLRCAILTQKKQTGRAVADLIRRELPEVPVENEVGAKPGEDNPFSVALLSLFRAAAHPLDHFSRGHVGMTPLGDLLAPDNEEDQWKASLLEILARVQAEGFESVARDWGGRALALVEPEAREFCRVRLGHFTELARKYDETGSRDLDAFVEYVRGHESTRGASEKSVRVMTIHRAKGLTFDLVILPELEGDSLNSLRRAPQDTLTLHVQTAESGDKIDWVLDRPSQFFVDADATLARVMEGARNEACFENLCKLYVAMTRPRQGLYLFSPPLPENSKSMNYLRLLRDTLDEGEASCREETSKLFDGIQGELAHARGTPGWFKVDQEPAGEPVEGVNLWGRSPDEFPVSSLAQATMRRPSAGKMRPVTGISLFGEGRTNALKLGSEVHALFEAMEWIDEQTMEALLAETAASAEAIREVRRCLENDETRAVLTKPEGETMVWREKSFCMMLDGRMVSGTFDRVVLRRGSDDSWSAAEIIDFKTDQGVENEAGLQAAIESHRSQLELYRQALARLTGLSETKVICQLLFTRVPCVATL